MESSQSSIPIADGPWSSGGDENVKVIAKIRPTTTPNVANYVEAIGRKALGVCSGSATPNMSVEFDFVASPHTSQRSFFKVAGRPMADHCLAFYNAAVIAYGPTGSGKTYTMLGSLSKGSNGQLGTEAGLIPRLLAHLFEKIQASGQRSGIASTAALVTSTPPPAVPPPSPLTRSLAAARQGTPSKGTPRQGTPRSRLTMHAGQQRVAAPAPGAAALPQSTLGGATAGVAGPAGPRYLVKCSMVQLYQEVLTDLIQPGAGRLQLRENVRDGVYVEGLSEIQVQSVDEALALLRKGISNRVVAETATNAASSRSHCVLTCHIECMDTVDDVSAGPPCANVGVSPAAGVAPMGGSGAVLTRVRRSRLHMVDLAGSERTAKDADAKGDRQKEANAINRSLLNLSLVIMRLSDKGQGPVPYRDSKLTLLLQDSLGGNAKTLIIANINPSMAFYNETQTTLGFAMRAKKIRNRAIVNADHHGNAVLMAAEIKRLRDELAAYRSLHSEVPTSVDQVTAWQQRAADTCELKLRQVLDVNGRLEAQVEALKAVNAKLKAEQQVLVDQAKASAHELGSMEAMIEQAEEELLKLRARPSHQQHEACLQELEQLRTEHSALQHSYEKLQDSYGALSAEHVRLSRELEASRAEVEAAQSGQQAGVSCQQAAAAAPVANCMVTLLQPTLGGAPPIEPPARAPDQLSGARPQAGAHVQQQLEEQVRQLSAQLEEAKALRQQLEQRHAAQRVTWENRRDVAEVVGRSLGVLQQLEHDYRRYETRSVATSPVVPAASDASAHPGRSPEPEFDRSREACPPAGIRPQPLPPNSPDQQRSTATGAVAGACSSNSHPLLGSPVSGLKSPTAGQSAARADSVLAGAMRDSIASITHWTTNALAEADPASSVTSSIEVSPHMRLLVPPLHLAGVAGPSAAGLPPGAWPQPSPWAQWPGATPASRYANVTEASVSDEPSECRLRTRTNPLFEQRHSHRGSPRSDASSVKLLLPTLAASPALESPARMPLRQLQLNSPAADSSGGVQPEGCIAHTHSLRGALTNNVAAAAGPTAASPASRPLISEATAALWASTQQPSLEAGASNTSDQGPGSVEASTMPGWKPRSSRLQLQHGSLSKPASSASSCDRSSSATAKPVADSHGTPGSGGASIGSASLGRKSFSRIPSPGGGSRAGSSNGSRDSSTSQALSEVSLSGCAKQNGAAHGRKSFPGFNGAIASSQTPQHSVSLAFGDGAGTRMQVPAAGSDGLGTSPALQSSGSDVSPANMAGRRSLEAPDQLANELMHRLQIESTLRHQVQLLTMDLQGAVLQSESLIDSNSALTDELCLRDQRLRQFEELVCCLYQELKELQRAYKDFPSGASSAVARRASVDGAGRSGPVVYSTPRHAQAAGRYSFAGPSLPGHGGLGVDFSALPEAACPSPLGCLVASLELVRQPHTEMVAAGLETLLQQLLQTAKAHAAHSQLLQQRQADAELRAQHAEQQAADAASGLAAAKAALHAAEAADNDLRAKLVDAKAEVEAKQQVVTAQAMQVQVACQQQVDLKAALNGMQQELDVVQQKLQQALAVQMHEQQEHADHSLQLEGQLAAKEIHMANVSAALDKARREHAQLLCERDAEITRLHEQCVSAAATLKAAAARHASLQQQQAQLEEALSACTALTAERDTVVQQQAELKERMSEQEQQAAQELNDAYQHIAMLEARLHDRQAELQESQAQVVALKEEATVQGARLQQMEAQAARAHHLDSQLLAVRAHLRRYETVMVQYGISPLDRSRQALTPGDLQGALCHRDNTAHELRRHVAALQRSEQALHSELQTLQCEYDKLQAQAAAATQQAAEEEQGHLAQQQASAVDEVRAAQRAAQQSDLRAEQLRQQLGEQQLRMERLQLWVQQLQEQLRDAEAKSAAAQARAAAAVALLPRASAPQPPAPSGTIPQADSRGLLTQQQQHGHAQGATTMTTAAPRPARTGLSASASGLQPFEAAGRPHAAGPMASFPVRSGRAGPGSMAAAGRAKASSSRAQASAQLGGADSLAAFYQPHQGVLGGARVHAAAKHRHIFRRASKPGAGSTWAARFLERNSPGPKSPPPPTPGPSAAAVAAPTPRSRQRLTFIPPRVGIVVPRKPLTPVRKLASTTRRSPRARAGR